MNAILDWLAHSEGAAITFLAAITGWLFGDVRELKRRVRDLERRRLTGRCFDRAPSVLGDQDPPTTCLLDTGHTGSHTDGRGCEWMYDEEEVP